VHRSGPLGYDEIIDLALYDPEYGFYESGGGAGRQGDFLTSPEVGPLFGATLARALDSWWGELGEPDPFTVVEVGAGRGALAGSVLKAAPRCSRALRYVAVERSSALRARHPSQVESASDLPIGPLTGIVLANELLDNMAFRLLERQRNGWGEVKVDDRLAEIVVPAPVGIGERLAPDASPGARIPVQRAATAWLESVLGTMTHGRVIVLDYADTTPSMARRPWTEWVRTYRRHGRGVHPLADLGRQDVTCEVAVDQLAAVCQPTTNRSQADFLRDHGIDRLATEARRAWQERSHIGDLEALLARSTLSEAAALTDPSGLGAFRVLEWARGVRGERAGAG